MPFAIDFAPDRLTATYWGHVTTEEVFASLSQIYGDPRTDDCFHVLADATSVTSTSLTLSKVPATAYVKQELSRRTRARRVAYVANTPEHFVIYRDFIDALKSAGNIGEHVLFTNREDAEQWLISNRPDPDR